MQSTKHQKWGKASAKALREQTFQVDGQQLFNSEKRGAGKYLTKILDTACNTLASTKEAGEQVGPFDSFAQPDHIH